MIRYIIRRTLYAIPILFGVSLVTFFLFYVAGGDPVTTLVGKHATPEELQAVRHEYGFDLPLGKQFLRYLVQLTTCDFERSFQTKQTIGQMLRDGASASLWLAAPAFLMSLFLSITLGLLAASTRGRWVDRTIVVTSVVGMSISILAYILFGQYLFAFVLNWFPISGYEEGFWARFQYLALPWIIWILVAVGADIRFFRTVFLDELHQDYARTAYAKGASPTRVLFVHVLRNALLPIITRVVIEIPFLFMGSLLLEAFFGIPGLGRLTIEAFNNADWPVIKAITFLGGTLYVVAHLVSDLLYAWADPRVTLS